MAQITIFGDFKTNKWKHLSMSGELTLLMNKSDINILNFEAPVRSSGKPICKSGPNICQGLEQAEWLAERGFTAVSLANNHTMDFGPEGLHATKQHLGSVIGMGAGDWKEAYKVHTFKTTDNMTIGVICCTHCEFGTLTDAATQQDATGCAHALNWKIFNNIRRFGGG